MHVCSPKDLLIITKEFIYKAAIGSVFTKSIWVSVPLDFRPYTITLMFQLSQCIVTDKKGSQMYSEQYELWTLFFTLLSVKCPQFTLFNTIHVLYMRFFFLQAEAYQQISKVLCDANSKVVYASILFSSIKTLTQVPLNISNV